jgi:hypothetical protein
MELDSASYGRRDTGVHTRTEAWLRFSSDPWHWFGGSSAVPASLTPLESFLF